MNEFIGDIKIIDMMEPGEDMKELKKYYKSFKKIQVFDNVAFNDHERMRSRGITIDSDEINLYKCFYKSSDVAEEQLFSGFNIKVEWAKI